MSKKFVISRSGGRRLMICCVDRRAEYLEDAPKSLSGCLPLLGFNKELKVALASLKEALNRFYELEARSLAKFGPPKMFRIWWVDAKLIQIDFKGGYAELRANAKSDATLKRCLHDMGANQLLLDDLRRELVEFLREENAAK